MNKSKRKNSNTGLILLIAFFIGCIGCLGMFLVNLINSNFLISNPQVIIPTTIPIETAIAQTVSAAQAQTQDSFSPTPLASPQSTTIFATLVKPTEYTYATNTSFVFLTPTLPLPSQNCNPYYPTVCLNRKPRFSCEELKERGVSNFLVLQPDPLGYDEDFDTRGCE